MVVRYALSSFAARILHYTLYILYIKNFSSFLLVTFKKGFRGDLYGVKKYQGSPQGLETIEKADEAFMQTIRNGEGF